MMCSVNVVLVCQSQYSTCKSSEYQYIMGRICTYSDLQDCAIAAEGVWNLGVWQLGEI